MSLQTTIKLGADSAEPPDKVTCRLCRRQFSKYTCPTCNVPYCSLTCFRSQSHSQCSETFYKKEVEADIRSEPSKAPQERLRMMELLKKFEEENMNSVEDVTGQKDEDYEDEDDLARRFQDVDLDSIDTEDLWSKLTADERTRFLKVMENPNSELAQQLLASEALEDEKREPWWESVAAIGESDSGDTSRRFGAKPEVLRIPSALVSPIPNGPPLFYNMCALCIAYSFVTRHLATSPLSSLSSRNADFQEGRQLISRLVPFLIDRKATTLFPNLTSLITDIWSRFRPGEMNSQLFQLLLLDAERLIRPLSVVTLGTKSPNPAEADTTSHPHVNLFLVLSDLSTLYESRSARPQSGARPNHITHKLLFYAAHMISIPSAVLRALAEEISERAYTYDGIPATVDVTVETSTRPGRSQSEDKLAAIQEI